MSNLTVLIGTAHETWVIRLGEPFYMAVLHGKFPGDPLCGLMKTAAEIGGILISPFVSEACIRTSSDPF
jgi:hypothetical protein